MEVHIDRDAFHKGLQMIQNIVEPHQTLPILANVLLEANGGGIRITATDLRIGARVLVPAKVEKKGTTTISARKLLEIIRELPAAELSVKVEEGVRIELRCGSVTYKLVGLAPADFPSIEPGASLGWVSLDAKLLRQMLAQTSFAISHDESRYALNGVLVSIQAGEIRLVATDGHRLALTSSPVPGASANAVGIVPRKAAQEVARVLGTGEEVQVALGENQFALKMPNFLLIARLIEGQFPNFEQVVPKGHSRRPVLSRSAFTAALRRVSVLSEERTKPVKLLLLPGTLKITAYSSEVGEAEETIPAEYAGEEITIAFNSRYLLDALGPIEADQVVMELKDGLSPGVLKSAGSEGALCVIMPMRL